MSAMFANNIIQKRQRPSTQFSLARSATTNKTSDSSCNLSNKEWQDSEDKQPRKKPRSDRYAIQSGNVKVVTNVTKIQPYTAMQEYVQKHATMRQNIKPFNSVKNIKQTQMVNTDNAKTWIEAKQTEENKVEKNTIQQKYKRSSISRWL
ncbi:MAG: hypothetical protein JJW01_01745 [Alphaproteobacteria bacterium]|nr:hypothetical protein [Rickettsiales bacterium]